MPRTLIITLLAILALLSIATTTKPTPQEAPSDTRVIYIVRHAEKADGPDPHLSKAGAARAEKLAQLIAHEPIAGVFVTNTNRSRETGAPIAAHNNLEATTYPPLDTAQLRSMIDKLPRNTNALIVAHSNTVSPILESLGAAPIGDLPEDEYDRLYAVVLHNNTHLRTIRFEF